MKSKTSHQSNENFAWEIQFQVVLSIVDKPQNFHDKLICTYVACLDRKINENIPVGICSRD